MHGGVLITDEKGIIADGTKVDISLTVTEVKK